MNVLKYKFKIKANIYYKKHVTNINKQKIQNLCKISFIFTQILKVVIISSI